MASWDDATRVTEAEIAGPDRTNRNRAYLIVLAGEHVGEMYKVNSASVVLGRGSDADVRLIDDGVSRLHARLLCENDEIVVEDLGSSNGTFCNGTPVNKATLQDGDKIQIGRTTILKFTYHDDLDESFQKAMFQSAVRDSLTGAYNKRYLMERLQSELGYSKRHNGALCLTLFDIDHFKQINDTHGHLAGDLVLAELGKAVTKTLRAEDVFARYGGEEFVILSRGTDSEDGHRLAERLRVLVEQHRIPVEGKDLGITVSVGIAAIPQVAVTTPEELIGYADRALYSAKESGRNQVVVYSERNNVGK